MTDKEQQEFDALKASHEKLQQRVIILEGANDVMNKRIIRTLDEAAKRGLLPKA